MVEQKARRWNREIELQMGEIVWRQDSTICKRHAHQHDSPSSTKIPGDGISSSCYRKLKNTSTITAILTTPVFAGLTNAATVLGVPMVTLLSAQTSEFPASQQRLNVWSGNRMVRKSEDGVKDRSVAHRFVTGCKIVSLPPD
jgi:hypothetical protein